MADSFKFELVSPERLVVSEDVTAVVAPGTEGYMTVMAHHAPLMATLKAGLVEVTLAGGSTRRIFIQGGFADINPRGFTLLAEQASDVADMDAADLDRYIEEAREAAASAADGDPKVRAEQRVSDLVNARDALRA